MRLSLERVDLLGTTERSPHSTETFRINSPPGPTAPFLGGDESSLGKDLRVVRDRRLTPFERPLEVAATHFLFTGDDREQSKSGGVGDGRQDCRELGGVWFRKWRLGKRCSANLFAGGRRRGRAHRLHHSILH